MQSGTDLVIPSEVAAFLEDGLIMFLGSRDAERAPECVLATAARVVPDDGRLAVYIAAQDDGATLSNLRDNGRAALTMSRVTDDRSLQMKGRFLGARTADEHDRAYLEGLLERREIALARVGMPRSVTARLVTWPSTRIEVRVEAIFEQTPGPGAGEPLRVPA